MAKNTNNALDYEAVRKLVPPERLLNYRVGEGWGPLCDFLGIKVPDFEFPHVNKTDQFLAGRAKRWWRAVGAMARKLGLPLAIAGGAGWLVWKKKIPVLQLRGLTALST